jgi:threonine dehydrogenase-like Zn-dependent dehydrogenase
MSDVTFLVIAATTAVMIAATRTGPKSDVTAVDIGTGTAGIVSTAEAIAATATAIIMRRQSSSCTFANKAGSANDLSAPSAMAGFFMPISARRK